MKKWYFTPIVLLIALCILVLSGCNPAASPTTGTKLEPIKIGSLLPLTGPFAQWGKGMQNGQNLALEMENNQVAGHPVQIIFEDEGGLDTTVALQKAKKLVQSDKVDVVLGPFYGSSAFTVMPYTSSVPIVNIKASEPFLDKDEIGNKYAFWMCPSYYDNTYPLGLWAYDNGIRTASSIGSDFNCGYQFLDGFKDAFASKGGKVIQELWAPLMETNYVPYLSKLQPADAFANDALATQNHLALYKQYYDLGLDKKFPLIINTENDPLGPILDQLGDMSLGSIESDRYLPTLDDPEAKKFTSAFESKYGYTPDDKASNCYATIKVLFTALRANGVDTSPDNLKAALLKVKMNVPAGAFSFSEGRIAMLPIRIVKVVKSGSSYALEVVKEYPPEKPHIKTYP